MGKSEHQLPLQSHQGTGSGNTSNSTFFTRGCIFCCRRISTEFNFKCMFILIFGMAVLISAIFSVIPVRTNHYGFDAKDSVKLGATIQAYFELEKPVGTIVGRIGELEFEIFGEIGLPGTKVAVLSMHEGIVYNRTNVVFGFLSDSPNVLIDSSISLSILRQSILDLFMQRSNLTFPVSFGNSSGFEILKFPSGITLNPEEYTPLWKPPQIGFNFTLNNSTHEIKDNVYELKEQLTKTLHLMQQEDVYVMVTNRNGSTRDPPVRVEAYITSDFGNLSPQRLKQLAQIITGPLSKNLGLNNKVFGKVKEISLSSLLNHSNHSMPPSHSPSPSPSSAPYPKAKPHFRRHHHHHLPPPNNENHIHPVSRSPSPSPSPVSNCHFFPSPLPAQSHHSFVISPAPSKDLRVKNPPSPSYSQPSEPPRLSPKRPVLPIYTYAPSPRHNSPVSAPAAASPLSSLAIRPYCGEMSLFALLLTFILL